ncbi:hypothetical protein SAMN04488692_104126 [Halarsenatibacter silvermanii]|uniref:Uncharacterized protein n=2 Tax=Halarsenatibacter silvermanii TaxID=321763 RepID=A0A1G9JYR1_9FIRM|nr:hypothetical protein SAMN04488692_104126 [Halarsenatibacter silvermanii]
MMLALFIFLILIWRITGLASHREYLREQKAELRAGIESGQESIGDIRGLKARMKSEGWEKHLREKDESFFVSKMAEAGFIMSEIDNFQPENYLLSFEETDEKIWQDFLPLLITYSGFMEDIDLTFQKVEEDRVRTTLNYGYNENEVWASENMLAKIKAYFEDHGRSKNFVPLDQQHTEDQKENESFYSYAQANSGLIAPEVQTDVSNSVEELPEFIEVQGFLQNNEGYHFVLKIRDEVIIAPGEMEDRVSIIEDEERKEYLLEYRGQRFSMDRKL